MSGEEVSRSVGEGPAPSPKDTAPDAGHQDPPLGDTVRSRRTELGLRQADLAALAGCSERFVHTVENGKASLRLDKLTDVLEVLGLELLVVRRETDDA